MLIRTIVVWSSVTLTAVAGDPAELFKQAEQLSRSNQKQEALSKVEEAVIEIQRAHAAGEEISWQARNGLRFAARLAREDFLDYNKSFSFCDTLFEIADTDYWRVPARLERALTYRAIGDFGGAAAEYDAIASSDPRQRASGILPRAEMVFFDMADHRRGKELITEALMNQKIQGRQRFATLIRCGKESLSNGLRQQAVDWYALAEKMPFNKLQDRDRFLSQAWCEMGKVEESRGRTQQAKHLYRNAMQLADGEMRYRVRARDALESIEYFE